MSPSSSGVRRRLLQAACAAWMAAIFVFSSIPGSDVPSRLAAPAHFVVFAVLGGLLLAALTPASTTRRAVQLATLVASIYAITDEVHQHFVPGRTPDVADWSLDTLGALAGALLVAHVMKKAALRRPSHVLTETPRR